MKSLLKLFYLLGGHILVSNILVSKVISFCLITLTHFCVTGWHSDLERLAASACMAAWSPAVTVPLVRGTHQLPPLHCAQCMFSSHPEGGVQSDPNPQNFQQAVGECIKVKLNRKNLRRRELSSSQQALKELKGRHGLQILKSVPKHWPYPGSLDVVTKTLDKSYSQGLPLWLSW